MGAEQLPIASSEGWELDASLFEILTHLGAGQIDYYIGKAREYISDEMLIPVLGSREVATRRITTRFLIDVNSTIRSHAVTEDDIAPMLASAARTAEADAWEVALSA